MVRLKDVLLITFLMSLWLHLSLNHSSPNTPCLFDIVKVQSPPCQSSGMPDLQFVLLVTALARPSLTALNIPLRIALKQES